MSNETRVLYTEVVNKLENNKPGRWYKVASYYNRGSATTISWMIRNGRGLKAFTSTPGTYDAQVRPREGGVEVWARKPK